MTKDDEEDGSSIKRKRKGSSVVENPKDKTDDSTAVRIVFDLMSYDYELMTLYLISNDAIE